MTSDEYSSPAQLSVPDRLWIAAYEASERGVGSRLEEQMAAPWLLADLPVGQGGQSCHWGCRKRSPNTPKTTILAVTIAVIRLRKQRQ